jgi:hypothetical protein
MGAFRRAPMHTNPCKQENQREDTDATIIPARRYWCGKLLLTQFFAALLFNFTDNEYWEFNRQGAGSYHKPGLRR